MEVHVKYIPDKSANSNTAASKKSKAFHTTCVVNCIAMSGIRSNTPTTANMLAYTCLYLEEVRVI